MSARIEDLEPETQRMCRAFLELCEKNGHDVRLTHTLRTMDEQTRLWLQGRGLPGPIVTNAKAGESAHNFAMAFDFCFNGKTIEQCYPPEKDPRWVEIGNMGESLGLNWGGPNGKGDKFTFDRPHFERRDWRTASAT